MFIMLHSQNTAVDRGKRQTAVVTNLQVVDTDTNGYLVSWNHSDSQPEIITYRLTYIAIYVSEGVVTYYKASYDLPPDNSSIALSGVNKGIMDVFDLKTISYEPVYDRILVLCEDKCCSW